MTAPGKPAPRLSPTRLTPAEKQRRRARRAWIPTIVIGGLIIIAIVVALAVQHSGAGKPEVEKAGDTVFNRAGIAALQKVADAQIDVLGPRQASAIDLPANGATTFGPFTGIQTELDLVGKHGIDSLFVDSFTVTTRDNYLTTITTTTRDFRYSDLHTQLEAEGVIGISNTAMAAFEDAMPVGAGGPTSHFALHVGTGTDLGIPTSVNVACDGAKGCAVTTLTTLARK